MQQEFYLEHRLPKLFVSDKLEQLNDIDEFLNWDVLDFG